MTSDIDSPDREPDREPVDESDNRMFTDSFAPHDEGAPVADSVEPVEEDDLDELEDLLPKGEPTEGSAPLP